MSLELDVVQIEKLGASADQLIENFKEAFDELKSLLKSEASEENFNKAYQNFNFIIDHYPLMVNFLSIPHLVRARPNYGKLFEEEYEISYNKNFCYKITAGRFNRPKEPLFYASLPVQKSEVDICLAACLEACKELSEDDKGHAPDIQDLTVGIWTLRESFPVINLCFDPRHLSGNLSLKEATEEYLSTIRTYFSKASFNFIYEFLTFFSTLSSTTANTAGSYYVLTALFCAVRNYYETQKGEEVYGLLNAGAMTASKGLNVVLTCTAVDKFLKLEKVGMFRFFLVKPERKTYVGYPCCRLTNVVNSKLNLRGYIRRGGE